MVLMVMFYSSCNSADDHSGKEQPDPVIPAAETFVKVTNGNYHLLYCTKADFLAIPAPGLGSGRGAILFKNYISASGLTLHGWYYKLNAGVFSAEPNLRLEVGKDTSLSFQTGSYIGDFILPRKQVRDIKQLLNRNARYNFVYFIPRVRTAGEIEYIIHLTEAIISKATILPDKLRDPTEFICNPIPPAGGNDLSN